MQIEGILQTIIEFQGGHYKETKDIRKTDYSAEERQKFSKQELSCFNI